MEENKELKLPSLNLDKVEEVVSRYEEKHVKHKHGAIIFVGSGGGKSTTYRNQVPDANGKLDFVDADLLYRETEAHPLQPGVFPLRPMPWWNMGPKIIQEVEKRCGIVNEAMVNHGLWTLTTSFDPDDAYIPDNIVIVLLPWEEHKKRVIEKFNSENYDAGAEPTEEGFARIQEHREWTEKVAREKNIPIVNSIESAITLIRSRE